MIPFKHIPYEVLKNNRRACEIVSLREGLGVTFFGIAKVYGISAERAAQIYRRQKSLQARLYINHISLTLGLKSDALIRNLYLQAEDCYRDRMYACAFLEKRFSSILTPYRMGEPGMPPGILQSLPPFKPCLTQAEIRKIVRLREKEKYPFATIARELEITREKAVFSYDWFYHQKLLQRVNDLQTQAQSYEEKRAIWNDCFSNTLSSRKRLEALKRKYG